MVDKASRVEIFMVRFFPLIATALLLGCAVGVWFMGEM